MHNYKELTVWQDSIDFVVEGYQLTKQLPREEQYVLIPQIRKAALSIPSNIAEGAGRRTDRDFAHFLGISYGSSCELETQLIVSQRLNYFSAETLNNYQNRLQQIQKKIFNLEKRLTR